MNYLRFFVPEFIVGRLGKSDFVGTLDEIGAQDRQAEGLLRMSERFLLLIVT